MAWEEGQRLVTEVRNVRGADPQRWKPRPGGEHAISKTGAERRFVDHSGNGGRWVKGRELQSPGEKY